MRFQFLSGMRLCSRIVILMPYLNLIFQFLSGMRLEAVSRGYIIKERNFQFLSGMRLKGINLVPGGTKFLSIPFWDATEPLRTLEDLPEPFNSFLGCDHSICSRLCARSRLSFNSFLGCDMELLKQQEMVEGLIFQFLSGMRPVMTFTSQSWVNWQLSIPFWDATELVSSME